MSKSEATWVRWEDAEIAPAVKRTRPHAMTRKLGRLPYIYCAHCGLVSLRNDATRRALKAQCVTWD